MKPINLIIFLVLFCAFTCQLIAQSKINLSDYKCQSEPVKYVVEGEQTEGILLFVNHYDREMPLRYTNVFLLSKKGENRLLVGDTVAFTGAYDFSVSPDYKYLAVYVVSEGHSWIEIYDLQDLINRSYKNAIGELNPYPGAINIVGWQNDKLIVDADINVLLINDNQTMTDKDMFEKNKQFYYDITSKKYVEKN